MGVKLRQKPPGSGKWWVFINHKGRRKALCVGTEKAAKKVVPIIEAHLVLGTFQFDPPKVDPPKVVQTFKEYSEQWLSKQEKRLKYSTLESYRSIVENHLSAFDAKALDAITRDDISNLIDKLTAAAKTRSTIKNVIAPLRGMFNQAVEDGVVTANPAVRIGRLLGSAKANRLKIAPLTRDEVTRLLDTGKEKYGFDVYALLLCACRTGQRMGELFGLEWSDLDFNSGSIQVRHTFVRGREETPKSHRERRLDMSAQLSDVLQELKARRHKEYLAKGQEVPRWVFVNDTGAQLDHSNFRKRVFEKLLPKAALRRIRFHDLRHTFASLLLQQGESPHYVKEQMGHHSIQVTVDIYGHLIPGANRRAVDRLDDQPKRVRNVRRVLRPRPVREGRRSSHGR